MPDKKVVLVTGCSSGIGLETAIECARQGHTVYATVRDKDRCTDLTRRIVSENLTDITILEMDVSDTNSIDSTFSTIIRATNKIDVLFNNAGFMIIGSLEDLTVNEMENQIYTDLMGPLYLTKLVIPHMRTQNSGLIINMSSVAGRIGFQFSSAYCISKFGIEAMTESLRRELASKNINVCLIEAGIVNTKFFENMKRSNVSRKSSYTKETDEMEAIVNKINKENWTQPDKISKLVAKLIGLKNIDCRYVVGDDAEYLIEALHHNKGDCERMDQKITEIMSRYLGVV